MRELILEQKKNLLEYLQQKGISDSKILNAFNVVPRERFVHPAFAKRAYEDISLPIGNDQTISQPFTVAYMTMLLEVFSGAKILEIGTGSGYQAAILSQLGASVFTIERHEELHLTAQKLLRSLNYSAQCFLSDGTIGLQPLAPFDRIIVTAGAPDIPKTLAKQLAIGGILVVPIGKTEIMQKMHVIKRNDVEDFDVFVAEEPFLFVPLIGEDGWEEPSEPKQKFFG